MLVIERNPLAQSILRATLESEVAAFEMADGGTQALDMLRAMSFDAIVAEGASIAMAGQDSLDSLSTLVAAAPNALFTVLWSGLTDEDKVELARRGAARVLAKPIGARALLDALRTGPPADATVGASAAELGRRTAA
jgi:DNA-binding response OmpR family regulator